jgi:hypothetical protein
MSRGLEFWDKHQIRHSSTSLIAGLRNAGYEEIRKEMNPELQRQNYGFKPPIHFRRKRPSRLL